MILPIFTDHACSSYSSLTDSWRRIGASYSSACDSRGDAIDSSDNTWYRFVGSAGKKLPESPNPQSMAGSSNPPCGTHATAWIAPPHPSFEDGIVKRKVCFAYNGNSCMADSIGTFNIDVLACKEGNGQEFYIYKLFKPRNNWCHAAYCAEGMCIICLRLVIRKMLDDYL